MGTARLRRARGLIVVVLWVIKPCPALVLYHVHPGGLDAGYVAAMNFGGGGGGGGEARTRKEIMAEVIAKSKVCSVCCAECLSVPLRCVGRDCDGDCHHVVGRRTAQSGSWRSSAWTMRWTSWTRTRTSFASCWSRTRLVTTTLLERTGRAIGAARQTRRRRYLRWRLPRPQGTTSSWTSSQRRRVSQGPRSRRRKSLQVRTVVSWCARCPRDVPVLGVVSLVPLVPLVSLVPSLSLL
jgi:hypothetical protein